MHRIVSYCRRSAMVLLVCGLCGVSFGSVVSTADVVTAPLTLVVTNTLDLARKDEVLSLSMADIERRRPSWKSQALAVRVAGRGGRLPSQRYASDGGATADRLLVLLDMAPRATVQLQIRPAAHPYSAKADPLYARYVPERAGDFAWENERVAFRIYGTPLEAHGGLVSSGIDVWSKRPPRLVIDEWYRRDARGQRLGDPSLSYHIDHGDGLDSYSVGHSPGDGGTAAWLEGAAGIFAQRGACAGHRPGADTSAL